MRIETLYIDGFGHFTQRTFGPFSAPITIFDGENEAGKTNDIVFGLTRQGIEPTGIHTPGEHSNNKIIITNFILK